MENEIVAESLTEIITNAPKVDEKVLETNQPENKLDHNVVPTNCSEITVKEAVSVGRWTAEEHGVFIKGCELHGKDWKAIADMVKTRTVVQTRTHAQKYFQKKMNKEKMANGENNDGTSATKETKALTSTASTAPTAPSSTTTAPSSTTTTTTTNTNTTTTNTNTTSSSSSVTTATNTADTTTATNSSDTIAASAAIAAKTITSTSNATKKNDTNKREKCLSSKKVKSGGRSKAAAKAIVSDATLRPLLDSYICEDGTDGEAEFSSVCGLLCTPSNDPGTGEVGVLFEYFDKEIKQGHLSPPILQNVGLSSSSANVNNDLTTPIQISNANVKAQSTSQKRKLEEQEAVDSLDSLSDVSNDDVRQNEGLNISISENGKSIEGDNLRDISLSLSFVPGPNLNSSEEIVVDLNTLPVYLDLPKDFLHINQTNINPGRGKQPLNFFESDAPEIPSDDNTTGRPLTIKLSLQQKSTSVPVLGRKRGRPRKYPVIEEAN